MLTTTRVALAALFLLVSACAGVGVPERTRRSRADRAREALVWQQAQHKRIEERSYERVMERARRRGYRVIWVNPPPPRDPPELASSR